MSKDTTNATEPNATQMLVRLGNRMRELRKAKGYKSHEHFAYDHGFGRSQYGLYEQGKVDLRFSNLVKLAAAYGVSIEELMGDLGE